jgi:hypothetical protein
MNQKRPLFGLCTVQIGISLIGFLASLVPAIVYTDPFWGVDIFVDKELFATGDSPGVIVIQLASGFPAVSAGLQNRDRILKINGKEVEFATFRQVLLDVQPEEPVTLDVRRGDKELRLAYQGEIPALEGVLFLDWQFVSAPIFLVLFLILVATQPLDPPPLWRALLVILGGLAVVTVLVVIEATQFVPWTPVWRSKGVAHGPPPALHYLLASVVLVAGLALAILGAIAARAVLMRRVRDASTPNPP